MKIKQKCKILNYDFLYYNFKFQNLPDEVKNKYMFKNSSMEFSDMNLGEIKISLKDVITIMFFFLFDMLETD